MRRRVTPPRYARKAWGAGKGGCLLYIVAGMGVLLTSGAMCII